MSSSKISNEFVPGVEDVLMDKIILVHYSMGSVETTA
jgi:hypothetical protein